MPCTMCAIGQLTATKALVRMHAALVATLNAPCNIEYSTSGAKLSLLGSTHFVIYLLRHLPVSCLLCIRKHGILYKYLQGILF